MKTQQQQQLAMKICSYFECAKYRGGMVELDRQGMLSHPEKIAAICTKESCGACQRFKPKMTDLKEILRRNGYNPIDVDCATKKGIKLLLDSTPSGESATVPNVIVFSNGKSKKIHPEEIMENEKVLLKI